MPVSGSGTGQSHDGNDGYLLPSSKSKKKFSEEAGGYQLLQGLLGYLEH